jgi:hypothetical protein
MESIFLTTVKALVKNVSIARSVRALSDFTQTWSSGGLRGRGWIARRADQCRCRAGVAQPVRAGAELGCGGAIFSHGLAGTLPFLGVAGRSRRHVCRAGQPDSDGVRASQAAERQEQCHETRFARRSPCPNSLPTDTYSITL